LGWELWSDLWPMNEDFRCVPVEFEEVLSACEAVGDGFGGDVELCVIGVAVELLEGT